MNYLNIRKVALFLAPFLFCIALSGRASAGVISDIYLKPDATGELDAVIKFAVPVQYLRHFPEQKSSSFVIYFNLLAKVSPDQWQDLERYRLPQTKIFPGFTVSTQDMNSEPKILVQFAGPVQYGVKLGRDGASIEIHIKPDMQQSTQKDGGVATPAPLPVLPVTPAPAPVTAPAAPALAESPASAAVAAPAVPQAMADKDGLPPFPAIASPAPLVKGEGLSLADQIKNAESQSAGLMLAGREALSKGQIFAAIEAFNKVLSLPANKYTQYTQVWIGIARERAGQIPKAKLEYQLYLRLYAGGEYANWVKERLDRLEQISPSAPKVVAPVPMQAQTAFQTSEYGSLSMYYYHGASHVDTITTAGATQIPTTLTRTDQSALLTNISTSLRSYNSEYDNRLVFQDMYSKNFLRQDQSRNRLNSAYFETRMRNSNFVARIGRQSAYGGGVLGRFDGVYTGYGVSQDWRVFVDAGHLAEATMGPRPLFYGGGVDFGLKSQVGGSVYLIRQTVNGLVDRQAVGGNLRYFETNKTIISLLDYDTQFKALNMFTLQGTLIGSGVDYNFLLDRRKTPMLSIRSAVNGTMSTIEVLQLNGWTKQDLIDLAKLRTAVASMAQIGGTYHASNKWQFGLDYVVSSISAMPASGTLNPDFTTGVEGFVAASPATGNMTTVSARLIGNDVVTSHGLTMYSLSNSHSRQLRYGRTFLVNNRAYLPEDWILDTTLRYYAQSDASGGKLALISPMLKLGYKVRNDLTLETEWGLERSKTTSTVFQSSTYTRRYLSLGFRWDF